MKVGGILLTMVMEQAEISRQVIREISEMLPADMLFPVTIPRSATFLEASAHGVPLALLHRNPPAEALLYDQIAVELERRTVLLKSQPAIDPAHANLLD